MLNVQQKSINAGDEIWKGFKFKLEFEFRWAGAYSQRKVLQKPHKFAKRFTNCSTKIFTKS